MGIVFPILLSIQCGAVLYKLYKNEPAQAYIIGYWTILLVKNLCDAVKF